MLHAGKLQKTFVIVLTSQAECWMWAVPIIAVIITPILQSWKLRLRQNQELAPGYEGRK